MILIKKPAFDALDNLQLIWTCTEPTIDLIRGRDYATKAEAYLQLNPGPRALLMFQVLLGHSAHGEEEFYAHLAYLLPYPGVWSALKNGMHYFGDNVLVRLLGDMEELYLQLQKGTAIDMQVIRPVIVQLDKALNEQMPASIKAIGRYIREHPEEFVTFEN